MPVPFLFHFSRVNHIDHVIDGDGCLSNVGGDDDFGNSCRRPEEHRLLVFTGQWGMKWINHTPARTTGHDAQGISRLFLLGNNLPAHSFASLDTVQSVTSPCNHPRPNTTTQLNIIQQTFWNVSSLDHAEHKTETTPHQGLWELQQLTLLSWGEKQKERANKTEKDLPWLESAHTCNQDNLSLDKGRLCAGNYSLFMDKDW